MMRMESGVSYLYVRTYGLEASGFQDNDGDFMAIQTLNIIMYDNMCVWPAVQTTFGTSHDRTCVSSHGTTYVHVLLPAVRSAGEEHLCRGLPHANCRQKSLFRERNFATAAEAKANNRNTQTCSVQPCVARFFKPTQDLFWERLSLILYVRYSTT